MPEGQSPSFPIALPPPQIPARGKQLRDLTMDALALFKREKFHPLKELIECFKEIKELDSTLSTDDGVENSDKISCKRLKFDVIKEIVQYGTPKLRSVEHTGEVNTGITIHLGVPAKEVRTIEMTETAAPLERLVEDRED